MEVTWNVKYAIKETEKILSSFTHDVLISWNTHIKMFFKHYYLNIITNN